MADRAIGNVCQYWIEIEPVKCSHWVSDECSYVGPGGSIAEFFPFCNLIGTLDSCKQYDGTGTKKRCVLPDPTRHVINRSDGKKWIEVPTVGKNGLPITSLNYDRITGYNNGNCDGFGTTITCSGFSPYILQFGVKQPDDKYGTSGVDAGVLTALSGVRLPLGYEIYNRRAKLGKCYFWEGEPTDFVVDETAGKVGSITFKCTQSDEIVQKHNGFKLNKTLNMYTAPCNGCKPECPHYTCHCWEYCLDSKTKQGDRVLAEQILELRWKIKKDSWDVSEYYKTFEDPEMYAWLGTTKIVVDATDTNKTQLQIPTMRTFISDFEIFEVEHGATTLTEGLNSDDYNKRYPTLVKQLKNLPLSPIVRNKFDEINGVNVFETNGRLEHEDVLLLGDTFYTDSEVYAINLSDPDLDFLPKELQRYDSMYNIEKALGTAFESFYNYFANKIALMQYLMPEKMSASELPTNNYMFYNPVKTFWGKNVIIVLSKIAGRWEYDSITIYKPYIGGVVGQTAFDIRGDGGEVAYLPAYDNDFGAYNNANGSIDFQFFPMSSDGDFGQASVAYAYIDGVKKRLPANPALIPDYDTYEFTYTLYRTKIESDLEVVYRNMRFFGNAGYCFASIYSKDLSNVVKPWEIEGKLELVYPDGGLCEMEVYEKCTDRLPVNCFIIRPKDINNFKMVCKDTYLLIEELYIYERKTFDSSYSESEIVREDFLTEDDVVQYRTSLDLHGSENRFTLEKFGYESLMAAIVYKGPTGRIIGQTKTKLIMSVRQPYCRDVEILYTWKALYKKYKLLPEHECYGPMSEDFVGNVWEAYTPRCGDHQRSYFTGLGPMWYPYNDCDSTVRYNYSTLGQFDIRIMDPFWEGAADPPHGQDDMRMLGPADHFGYLGESHSSIWTCLCDYTYYNSDKLGDNIFAGYAFYRGGLDEAAQRNCVRNDGSLPIFGNVYRDFLRSYRSMDNVDYYYWNGSQYLRRRKWVPMYEFYAPAFSESLSNYPYLLYSYSDYTDDNSTFMHPFGCLLADFVEGVSISERISVDEDDGAANRYRFDEVFRSHSTSAGIYYPMPKDPQQQLINGNLVDIMPWYTFKDYPGPGGGDYNSIQWAWQEYWKPAERQKITEDNVSYYGTILMGNHPTTDTLPITLTMPPYIGEGDILSGRHAFLDLAYPNYRYDGTLKEHRLVCAEAENVVTVFPPTASGEGAYGDNPIWHVQLNNGPKRCFDMDGAWLTVSGEECNIDLYEICTTDPWASDVTLFDTGYDSETPDTDRTITHYDTIPPTYDYYQRGLNASIRPGSLGFLPRHIHKLEPDAYEMRLSPLSTCDEDSGSEWASVEDVNQFYPGSRDFNVVYCSDSNELTITFKFANSVSLGAVGINYKFGAEKDPYAVGYDGNYTEKGVIFSGNLYHLPGIKLYKSDDDGIYTAVYSLDSMKLATKTDTIVYPNGFYEFTKTTESVKPIKYLKMTLRLLPSVSEVDAVGGDYEEYFFEAVNKIAVNYIYIYYNEFVESTEALKTYERLYNVSYGGHGNFPPHGYDSTGSLLYVIPNDKSTVYQMDSIGGVVGMPGSAGDCKSMNKVRGRIMKECHPDKERLEGLDLTKWEEEQKKIHDEIAIESGSTTITLRSQPPPNMQYLLDKAGVNFPSWTCYLENSLVAPLLPVYPAIPYSPCGHTYVRDLKTMHFYQACAVWGSIFGRIPADVFEIGFRLYCGGEDEVIWQNDILGVPPIGVAMSIDLAIKRQFDKSDEVNARLRATASSRNLSKYSYPSPVDPIY